MQAQALPRKTVVRVARLEIWADDTSFGDAEMLGSCSTVAGEHSQWLPTSRPVSPGDAKGELKGGKKGIPAGKVILIGAGVVTIAYGIPWLAEKWFEHSFRS